MSTKDKITQHITVAVIDDHDLIREHISEMLIDFAFSVVLKARHGRELLEQLSNSTASPDVCLLDISMSYPQIKILAYSMDTDDKTVAKILQCGAHDFAEKNIEPDKLKDKLIGVLL